MQPQPLSLFARWHLENILVVPLAVAFAAAIGFWALVYDRIPPVALVGGVVTPKSVKPGAAITATWNVEVHRSGPCQATILRSIVDSQGTVWRIDTSATAVMPENGVLSRTIAVPYSASWGAAKYRLNSCYECAGFSLTRAFPICSQWPDLPFEIASP
jgi:hypothetical protein